jgi:hypothetical protein
VLHTTLCMNLMIFKSINLLLLRIIERLKVCTYVFYVHTYMYMCMYACSLRNIQISPPCKKTFVTYPLSPSPRRKKNYQTGSNLLIVEQQCCEKTSLQYDHRHQSRGR